ncbi:MAG TPA: PilW family protein [Steroidobacteraceae bacterium]|nr:PilW family protein [Steroidobacteraceae bacterium]
MRNTVANQRGLSLIELMVSLVIGALLIAGAVTVYMQSRNTYRTNDVASRMQEVARYALDVMAPDVRLAGYWGLTNRPDSFTNGAGAVTKDCAANFTANVAQPIQGLDALATGGTGYPAGWQCTIPAGFKKVDWSDILIVRRGGADPVAFEAGRVQIQSNRETAALFSNGSLPAGFGAGDLSETHDMMVGVYYVAESTTTLNGRRMFSLHRQTLVAGPTLQDEEIISGVQDMQVQFGLDVDGNGTVERYVNPEDVIPAGARIATVQLWLLVVAEEREIGFTDDHVYTYANATQTADVFHDDRRRVLVTKTIQVRNAAT